jgi:DNA-binding CsgD family transcriptional regulator
MPHLARAARESLIAVARRPSDGPDFAESVMTSVRDVVAFDGYCLLGLDPVTGLRSLMFSRNGLDGMADRLAHNESVESDLNRYVDLAASASPIGILSLSGLGGPRSPRLHEIIRPAGFTSELRLALRSRGRLWGALVLFRGDRQRPFSEADSEAVMSLADPLSMAIRRYPVRDSAHHEEPLPPGVITLGHHNEVVSITDHASAWLEDVRAGGRDEISSEDVMRVVYDVGLVARTTPDLAFCRVRTTSGRWLLVHGEPLEPGSSTIAVVLAPAALEQVLPAASACFGLTRREHDVLRLVALGLPARHISRRLGLSELTVNDHLGSTYRKAAVSGREELLARMS